MCEKLKTDDNAWIIIRDDFGDAQYAEEHKILAVVDDVVISHIIMKGYKTVADYMKFLTDLTRNRGYSAACYYPVDDCYKSKEDAEKRINEDRLC